MPIVFQALYFAPSQVDGGKQWCSDNHRLQKTWAGLEAKSFAFAWSLRSMKTIYFHNKKIHSLDQSIQKTYSLVLRTKDTAASVDRLWGSFFRTFPSGWWQAMMQRQPSASEDLSWSWSQVICFCVIPPFQSDKAGSPSDRCDALNATASNACHESCTSVVLS